MSNDSYWDICTPDLLTALLAGHITRMRPKPRECHGLTYAFRGHGTANDAAGRPEAKPAEVARSVGFSAGTVSNVLDCPDIAADQLA
ncbi:hypothetical protein [Streptomyces sp. NPDC058294]|uniref:hypothetical protein n=1 Tax=Streptomyces sp. NPDC058294 TaxID=3346430 RepID=UPI0036ED271B